jgi:PEGA domain-containing protein
MSKALSSICLAFVLCFAGSAWAEKPKLAILGLEVTPGANGTVDPAATQAAKDITKELRSRAQSGASPYVMAPNSSKELTDEKLLMSCDNEAKDCMAVIGAGLAADMLLYGRVEKKGEIYKVSLKLLDVKTKTLDVGSDEMPVGASATGVSKRLYSKLIGDSPTAGGSLVVTARTKGGDVIDGGKVMIDEERKGALAGGKLTVAGVPEGRHVVAIEAGGYRRFEETVTVHSGQPVKLEAILVEREASMSVSASPQSHALRWKVTAGAGLAVAAIGGGMAWYGDDRQQAQNRVLHLKLLPGADANARVGGGDCGQPGMSIMMAKKVTFDTPAFDRACHWHTVNVAGFVIAGVGGAVAIASVVFLILDKGSEEKPPTSARSKKSNVAIAPILAPDVAGASLSVTW